MAVVAVVGAGLMGSGIAQVAAQAGHQVRLRDIDDHAVERGLTGIDESLARFLRNYGRRDAHSRMETRPYCNTF